MYQSLTLIGNLGKDPELRFTPSGQQVCNFSVATSEKWTGQDGQAHDKTIWWRVTCWGKQAENVNTYLKKGNRVLVVGRITGDDSGNPRTFTRTNGETGSSFEVTAQTIKFLTPKGEGGAATVTPTSTETADSWGGDDTLPF